MKEVATDGEPVTASTNSGVDPKELTEARGPLIMATERSVKYHQDTPPSRFVRPDPSKKFYFIRPLGKAFSNTGDITQLRRLSALCSMPARLQNRSKAGSLYLRVVLNSGHLHHEWVLERTTERERSEALAVKRGVVRTTEWNRGQSLDLNVRRKAGEVNYGK